MTFAPLCGVPEKKSRTHRLLLCARYFKKTGRLTKAADFFRQILLINPNDPDALYSLGLFAHETGQLEDAVQLIVQSLRVNSNQVEALAALAAVLKDQKRYPEAVEFYQAALELTPNAAILHAHLGDVYTEMQLQEEAIGRYQRALELNPGLKIESGTEAVQRNLNAALYRLGRLPKTIAKCWQAFELEPDSFLALNNLGNAFGAQRQFGQAAFYLKKAHEVKPDCFYTLNSLGAALKEQGKFEEALICFKKAVAHRGDLKSDLQIYRNMGATHYAAGRSKEAVACFRKELELNPDCASTFSDLLFALNHLQENTPEELFAEHLRFGKQFNHLRESKAYSNTPDRERRLRLGFVSGDLRDHALAYFIEPVLVNLSKSQFEVFCYHNHPMNDAVSERLRRNVDFWSNVDLLTDDELSNQIRKDRIDILVDLSGHTARNRLLVFARKPAPVQVTMIGYMQTTGLAAMDYRISDEALDTTGTSEHLSSETLVRLAAGATKFIPPSDCPSVNELPALKNGYITFGSFNKPSKITPEIFDAWARILKATPGSRLVVIGLGCNSVAATMAAHGIAPERLEFHGLMPTREYLALHNRVDFCLDTFPYNGGTTSLFAVWMGLPLVSIQGPTPISRSGATILWGVGLPELIAPDYDEYVKKAVSAVQDLPRLAGWRSELRSRLSACIGDGSDYTQQLEQAFLKMWETWCDSQHSVELIGSNSWEIPEHEMFGQFDGLTGVTHRSEADLLEINPDKI